MNHLLWVQISVYTLDIWVCVYRYTAFCVYVDGRKEGDNPCGLSITDTDLCVYVQHASFCEYVVLNS